MTDPVSPELKEEQMASSASLPAHALSSAETDTPCDLDLDALEKVARAATQGEWTFDVRPQHWAAGGKYLGYEDGSGLIINHVTASDIEHFATFDPPTVLKLIAAVRNRRADTASGGRGEGISAVAESTDAPHFAAAEEAQRKSEARPFRLIDLAEVATKAIYTHGFGFREVVGPTQPREGKVYVNLCWDDDTLVRAAFWIDPEEAPDTAATVSSRSLGEQPEAFEQMFEGPDGWSEWIHPTPGYRMKCCGCDLVHDMEFEIAAASRGTGELGPLNDGESVENGVIIFRARRSLGEGG
jgi:hypothetical protein